MKFVFPNEAIAVLRGAQFDPGATCGYELLSGGITWSDEQLADFVGACMAKGCGVFGYPLAYRTSLIEGKPRENLRFTWDELQLRCPEWIGFRAERVTPSPQLLAFLKQCREEDW